MKAINLSPSFLSKLYDKGYDYAVGEKLGLIKRGRRIRNIDFLTALRRSNAKYARMEVTHFSNTVNDGILYARKAEDFAKVFRDSFGIDCEAAIHRIHP